MTNTVHTTYAPADSAVPVPGPPLHKRCVEQTGFYARIRLTISDALFHVTFVVLKRISLCAFSFVQFLLQVNAFLTLSWWHFTLWMCFIWATCVCNASTLFVPMPLINRLLLHNKCTFLDTARCLSPRYSPPSRDRRTLYSLYLQFSCASIASRRVLRASVTLSISTPRADSAIEESTGEYALCLWTTMAFAQCETSVEERGELVCAMQFCFRCPSGYGYLAYCPQPVDWDNYTWCCTWPYMGTWKPACCPFAIPTG